MNAIQTSSEATMKAIAQEADRRGCRYFTIRPVSRRIEDVNDAAISYHRRRPEAQRRAQASGACLYRQVNFGRDYHAE